MINLMYSQRTMITSLDVKSQNFCTRGYQKVRRLMQWAMHTKFVENIKQQMFNQLWKFKLDTLTNHHFIIKYILYGMVTLRSLCWVPWRSTTSLFFHVALCTLINTLQAKYTEVKYQLKQFFYMNIKFDELLSKIYNVLHKGKCKLTMSAWYA